MSVPGTYSSMYMSAAGGPIEFMGHGSFSTSTGSDLTPTVHGSTIVGDFLLLQVNCNATQTVSTPSGWTAVGTNATSAQNRQYVFRRFYDGTTPTVTSGGGDHLLAIISTWRNVNASTPMDATQTQGTGIDSFAFSATCPTTVTNKAVVITLGSCRVSTAVGNRFNSTANTSLTNAAEAYDLSSTNSDGGGMMLFYGSKDTAGAVNNTTATMANSTSAENWSFHSVALRPAT